MSGALKAVKKTFKKVVSNPLKLIPAALGIGALVFTAGSALGALPSWGSAVGDVFGTDSVLGRVLTGAATQAGYGAVLGGAGAALTGGDISNGIEYGGGAGAVTGGVAGGLGFETDLLKGLVRNQPAAGVGPGAGAPSTGSPATGSQFVGPLNSSAMVANGSAPALAQVSQAAPALGGAAPKGLLSSLAGGNDDVIGRVIAGAGAGWAQGLQSQDQSKALLQRDAAERAAISANYGGTKGLLTKADAAGLPSGNSNPIPTDRFDPSTYGGSWVYDPTLAKIVYVKNQAPA